MRAMILTWAAVLWLAGAAWAADPPRTNLVFILTDDQGAWSTGCYGNPNQYTGVANAKVQMFAVRPAPDHTKPKEFHFPDREGVQAVVSLSILSIILANDWRRAGLLRSLSSCVSSLSLSVISFVTICARSIGLPSV